MRCDRTLGPYQHGQQPKAGSSFSQWPPPTVQNPWDKEFSPRTFLPPIWSLPPYWSAGNSMKTHLTYWNLKPPPPLIKSQTQRLPSVLPGLKPLQPDLLTLLPYPLRPWKLYITSFRKSSFSYVPLLSSTLSRMTFLSRTTSYSESSLLSWRLNSCPMTQVWLPLNCTHTLAYASKAHHTGVSRSRPASITLPGTFSAFSGNHPESLSRHSDSLQWQCPDTSDHVCGKKWSLWPQCA